MAKEDLLLREEMGRLEIEPIKVIERKNENPFNIQSKRGLHINQIPPVQISSCTCISQKRNKNAGICKKKINKILKEPVLQVIKSCIDKEFKPECSSTPENLNIDSLNLCTLVTTCNQLKISSDSKEQNAASTWSNENKWWKNGGSISHYRRNREVPQHTQAECSTLRHNQSGIREVTQLTQAECSTLRHTQAGNREVTQHTQAGSCSQQALNPPCDVTIDELASYFETLVHIPKKMSSMAEMMYI